MAKILLTIVNLVSLYFSVYSFRKCSASDPGIIPVLPKQMTIANTNASYYVKYKTKEELELTMKSLGVKDPAGKYYNLNKFEYIV